MAIKKIELGRNEKVKKFVLTEGVLELVIFPIVFYIAFKLDEPWELAFCVLIMLLSFFSSVLLYHSLCRRFPASIDVECSKGFAEWQIDPTFTSASNKKYVINNNILHIPFSDIESAKKTILGNLTIQLTSGRCIYFFCTKSAAEEFIECYKMWRNTSLKIIEIPINRYHKEIFIMILIISFCVIVSYFYFLSTYEKWGIQVLTFLLSVLCILTVWVYLTSLLPEKLVIDFGSKSLRWKIKSRVIPMVGLESYISNNEIRIPFDEIKCVEYFFSGITRIILKDGRVVPLPFTNRALYNKIVEHLPLRRDTF